MRKSTRICLPLLLAVLVCLTAVHAGAEGIRSYNKEAGGWQYALMGEYPYEKDGAPRPVLWRVLSAEDGKALLLAEEVLDVHQVINETDQNVIKSRTYRRIASYQESDLYTWMNGEMLETLLPDPAYRELLIDEGAGKLYCLTTEQFTTARFGFSRSIYGENFPDRKAYPTPYYVIRGGYVDQGTRTAPYWAATIRSKTGYQLQLVGYNGHLSWGAYTRVNVGVRPALTVDLARCGMTGAGTKDDPFVIVPLETQAAPAGAEEPSDETEAPEAGDEPEEAAGAETLPDEPAEAPAPETAEEAPEALPEETAPATDGGTQAAPDEAEQTALPGDGEAGQPDGPSEAADLPIAQPSDEAPAQDRPADGDTPAEPAPAGETAQVEWPVSDEELARLRAAGEGAQEQPAEPAGAAEETPAETGAAAQEPEEQPAEPAGTADVEWPMPDEELAKLRAEQAAPVSPYSAPSMTLSFIGDLSIGDATQSRSGDNSLTSVIEREGYAYPFSLVSEWLTDDDYTFANLEVCLTERDVLKSEKKYNMIGKPDFVNVLLEGGIDVLNTVNNHCMDFTLKGYEDTLAALDGAGLNHFGSVYPGTDRGSDILGKAEVCGVKFGMVGYSYPQEYDLTRLKKRMQTLRDEGCELIVCSLHWGREEHLTSQVWQYQFARDLIDAGADVVWGHHPHVLQPVMFYKGKPIFFSTGNFIFGTMSEVDPYTGIFRLTYDLTGDKPVLTGFRVVPCMTGKRGDYRPYELTDEKEIRTCLSRLVSKKKITKLDNLPDSFLETGAAAVLPDGTLSDWTE